MTRRQPTLRIAAIAMTTVVTLAGCSFHGLTSLPLPGTVGRGPDAQTYRVEISNIGTLEPNSPVLINDVVVGTVSHVDIDDWHAVVDVSVRPDVVVPANAIATVGQTSLLGSMHVSLDPPLGVAPHGRLRRGTTLGLHDSRAYPSTEQTLSSLSMVVNAGGLGQIGDIVRTFNAALSGREPQIRDLLTKLDRFVGTFDAQRVNVIASIADVDRLADQLNARSSDIAAALHTLPETLDILLRERPRITNALEELGKFSDTAAAVATDTKTDLVRNLTNLAPTIQALADVGPDIDTALAFLPVYPLGQNVIDRGVRGDYMNLFVTLDLTRNRLKRGLAAGTRWGDEDIPLVPAPGDPGYDHYYSTNPLGLAVAPPPPQAPREPVPPGPAGALPPGAPPPPSAPPSSEGGS
jgi:phospholipid/cholesterol/gamma-HCH transport system substrate-binding protein